MPSKLNSQRVPRKNVQLVGGRPMVNWVLHTLGSCLVDDIVVYAADDEIVAYIEDDVSFRYVERPSSLDTDDTTVQDFIDAFLNDVPGDVIVLLHITSPFMSAETVDECITAVTSGRHDSAFAAFEMQRFAWYGGRPINYSLDEPTPRTQDLAPVIVEQSGLYVFTRALFTSTGRRIGDNPFVRCVGVVEGHDIDTREELELANLLVDQLPSRTSKN